jgi:hypothetical protein
MITNFLTRFVAVPLMALMFPLLGHSASNAGGRTPEARQLEGTWTVTVTVVDCQSGNPLGNPFQSLLTFGRGGTLTETTANPMFFPAERGPGHGYWNFKHHSYNAVSTAFITSSGVLAKTQTITQNIHMGNSDQLTSAATVQFFDPAGNVLASGCATAAGQRFK